MGMIIHNQTTIFCEKHQNKKFILVNMIQCEVTHQNLIFDSFYSFLTK